MPKQNSQNKPYKQGFVWLSTMARHTVLTIGFCLGLVVAPIAPHAQTVKPLLVFGQEAPPPTLDPYFTTAISTRNVAMHIFEQLVTRDETNAVIPELAESWTVSPDGLTYTFKLLSATSAWPWPK